MRRVLIAAVLAGFAMPVFASETTDAIAASAYAGQLPAERETFTAACEGGDVEACFGAGLAELIYGYETLSQALYRHGAVAPADNPAALLLGIGLNSGEEAVAANPDPEPLTYEGFRAILEESLNSLDTARGLFERAGEAGEQVILLDPLRIRLDVDGDGQVGEDETLAPFFTDLLFLTEPGITEKQRSKGVGAIRSIGFDRADALWFAGYTQVTAAPIDWLLAHDFSPFFNAYMHHIFPHADLPMGDYSKGGVLFLDGDSDAGIADMIAAIHSLGFSVTDTERLAGVLDRLKAIPDLSRRNWEAILAETDDNFELVPSPSQTSLVASQPVTQEIVDAWLSGLGTVDRILAGELTLPHWRFDEGFDLARYFETATRTDLVLLMTGHDALQFLSDSPTVKESDFAEINRVMGVDWPLFALWFN